MPDKLALEIGFEIDQIERLLAAFAGLLARAPEDDFDLEGMAALSTVLQSFYNGVENILLRVAKRLDGHVPGGEHWHQQLIVQMTERTDRREAVLSLQLAKVLNEYRGLRHLQRHMYAFLMEWPRMRDAVLRLHDTWSQTKQELAAFLATIAASLPDKAEPAT